MRHGPGVALASVGNPLSLEAALRPMTSTPRTDQRRVPSQKLESKCSPSCFSEDSSKGQKTDRVNETSYGRHSEEGIGSDFLRGLTKAYREAIHHPCRKIFPGVDLVFTSVSLFSLKICIPSITPSNSGCGLTGFLSRTYPHRKSRSRLETTYADSLASALPRPDDGRRSAHYFSLQE